jgi:hypothetical protein
MPFVRKTKGTDRAPYGFKKDGTPKGKPGRKAKPKKPKGPHKKPGPAPKPKPQKDPSDMRGKVRKNRGGFKKNGTPMPSTHNAEGRITKDGAQKLKEGRPPGRPKGSFSIDRIIKEELQRLIKGAAKGEKEQIARQLIRKLIAQGLSSPIRRLAITRFVTERSDGKAVQPIKDVTPRDPLDELTDEQFNELLRRRGKPQLSPVPERNTEAAQPEPSPSPPEERPAQPTPAKDAPPPSQPTKPKQKKTGGSGLSS